MSKFMFIQEYLRVDHTIQHRDGSITIDFLQSTQGKNLLKLLRKFGIERKDVSIGYMFPKVPEVERVSASGKPLSYREVTQKQAGEVREQVITRILEEKPEVVIPNGKLGCKFFVDMVSIQNSRGIPVKSSVENEEGDSHEFWVLPIYSMEYMSFTPSVGRYVELDLQTLQKFNEVGEKVFLPSEVEYEVLTDIEDIRALFKHVKEEKPVTAWDLETNTLRPEMEGAKALVVSLSYKEGTGYTIPLEHKGFTWEEEDLQEIIRLLREFVADTEVFKVGANIQFDIRFLMSAYGFKYFANHMDTQVAYWMVISQERNTSRRLGSMAYEFTDMGGYDDELENFVKEYPGIHKKEHGETPVNEVDGSKVNYEWIPFDMLSEYASADADVTLRIHNKLWEKIKTSEKWIKMYTDFYPRFSVAGAQMEANGMYVDIEYTEGLVKAYEEETTRIIEELRETASVKIIEDYHKEQYEIGLQEWEKPPKERDKEKAKLRNKYRNKLQFNPNSNDDKGILLYDILDIKLPFDKEVIKDSALKRNPRTHDDLSWNDWSANAKALGIIQGGDYSDEAKVVARLLSEYALAGKLKSSFVDRALIDVADDGAIHGNIRIHGTACVKGDTLIPTNNGLVEIEDISPHREEGTFTDVDYRVASKDGEEDVGGFLYTGFREGVELTLVDGTKLTTTKNHPLLKNNFFTVGAPRTKDSLYNERVKDLIWANAEDIKERDYIAVKIGTNVYGNKTKLSYDEEKHTPGKFAKHNVIPPKEMTKGLAEFLGMYYADGSFSTSNGSFSVTLTNSNKYVREMIAKRIVEELGLPATYMNNRNRSKAVGFASKHIGEWFEDELSVKSRAQDKVIPKQILQAPKEIQQAFLRGLTLDSAINKKKYLSLYYHVSNEASARKIQTMLNNMGIFTRLAKRKNYSENRVGGYDLMITGKYLHKFIEEIGFIETFKQDTLLRRIREQGYNTKYRGIIADHEEYMLIGVKGVKEVANEEFFDLNVPGSHTFIGNSVVNHNTGRTSSNNPNIQTLPASHNDIDKFDYKYPIKRMYTSRFENGVILQNDYSALEMRVLALVAEDEEMTKTFLAGDDIHKETASIVYEKPADQVTHDEREASKTTAFGLIYGRGAPGLASQLQVSEGEAQAVMDKFMSSKPAVRGFTERTHEFLRQNGYVETLNGHRRLLQDVYGGRSAEAGALRQSLNTVVQGTGAYLTNLSFVLIDEYIRKFNKRTKLIASVHDSIVLDVPEEEIEEMTQALVMIMENLPEEFLFVDIEGRRERYPIVADSEIGLNYNDVHEFNLDEYRTFKSYKGYLKYKQDLKEITANYDSKVINEDQFNQLTKTIGDSKIVYQQME